MSNTKSHNTVRKLVESAIMIAIGTVLSELKFPGFWVLGGGITFCSMLPLVFISHRYGCKWGLFTAFVYSLLQLVLGVDNVQYADSFLMAAGIVLLDYVVPYTLIGLAAMFNKVVKNRQASLILGIVVTFALRLACHFITGTWIWEVLWPNELGWAAPVWSIAYNASYMVPEIIITAVVAALLYATPLKRYFLAEDLNK